MNPLDEYTDAKHPDMSPAAIDKRLRDLAQIYKLGMSLRNATWVGPVNPSSEDSQSAHLLPTDVP